MLSEEPEIWPVGVVGGMVVWARWELHLKRLEVDGLLKSARSVLVRACYILRLKAGL